MGRKRKYNREEVLEKSLALFWKYGYEGTSLNELVSVTGLNRFSFYKEFESKEALFDEAMKLYLDNVEGFLGVLTEKPEGISTILKFFRGFDVDLFLHGCFMINSFTEKHVIKDATYKRGLEWMERFEEALDNNIKISMDNGELREDIELSAESIKSFLVAVDSGLTIMTINYPQSSLSKVVDTLELFFRLLKK